MTAQQYASIIGINFMLAFFLTFAIKGRRAKRSILALSMSIMIAPLISKVVIMEHVLANPIIVDRPVEVEKVVEVEKEVVKEIPQENMDTWVNKYVNRYFVGYQVSEMKMIMHCLLHRESGHQAHGENGPHGDNGKAGGVLQFHQETWERMRGQMLKTELIDEVGSRYNVEQAIHTTVWAIKNGNAKEWGPILRWSKGKYNEAACPVPSWYK